MSKTTHARLFWSGGSQAVRIPRELRLPGTEVKIRRHGNVLEIEPVATTDDWNGFWDRLVPLKAPVKRWKPRAADKRKAI